MKSAIAQIVFLGAYLALILVFREWARLYALRRAEEERERRTSLEREWRVGIPYDPEEP